MVMVWIPFVAIFLGVIYALVEGLCRFPRRTITEVKEFLREVDLSAVLPHLHPSIADVVRDTFPRAEYREAQRRQLHFIQEALERIAHNGLIFIQLANTEIWRETKAMPGMEDAQKYIELGQEVHHAAVEIRFYAICTLMRIKFWMIFRTHGWSPFPAPYIPDLRQLCGLSLDASYVRLRDAVSALCLAYGQEFHDEIMTKI